MLVPEEEDMSFSFLYIHCGLNALFVFDQYTRPTRIPGVGKAYLRSEWLILAATKSGSGTQSGLSFRTEAFYEATQHQQMRICFASSVSSRFHIIVDSGCL
jgi:hypothetical protein